MRLGGGITQLTVVAIVSNSLGGFDAPTHFISHAVLDAEQEGLLDTVIYLSLADEAVVGEVRSLVAATPGSLLQSGDSYVANVSTEVDSFRNFIYSLLALTWSSPSLVSQTPRPSPSANEPARSAYSGQSAQPAEPCDASSASRQPC